MRFLHLGTQETAQYRADNPISGEGIFCYDGHKSQYIFAFAEKTTRNPKILVKSYPSFKTIHAFDGKYKVRIPV